MGLIANYSYLSDENLKELKSLGSSEEDIIDSVEDWSDEEDVLLDIDKMWDVLHFVLTGVSTDHRIDDNPLSQAVLGVTSIEDLLDYMAYTEHPQIADIVTALDKFDIEQTLETFDMMACKEAELYPDIWYFDDDKDEIIEEILDYFEHMKGFYKKVLESNGNVLITIY